MTSSRTPTRYSLLNRKLFSVSISPKVQISPKFFGDKFSAILGSIHKGVKKGYKGSKSFVTKIKKKNLINFFMWVWINSQSISIFMFYFKFWSIRKNSKIGADIFFKNMIRYATFEFYRENRIIKNKLINQIPKKKGQNFRFSEWCHIYPFPNLSPS